MTRIDRARYGALYGPTGCACAAAAATRRGSRLRRSSHGRHGRGARRAPTAGRRRARPRGSGHAASRDRQRARGGRRGRRRTVEHLVEGSVRSGCSLSGPGRGHRATTTREEWNEASGEGQVRQGADREVQAREGGQARGKEIEKVKRDDEKPIEKIKPEKEQKLEIKEIEKPREKVVPDKLDKENVEAGMPGEQVVNPAELMAHVESLEETARQLRRLIQRSSRPDLSQGALLIEDLGAGAVRWEHRVGAGGAATTITTADGRTLRSTDVGAVLNHVASAPLAALGAADPDDRDYARNELSAFAAGWLRALSANVVNAPDPHGLCGRWRRPLHWRVLAAQAGMRCAELRLASAEAEALEPPSATLLAVDGRVLADGVPARLQAPCARLSAMSQARILGLRFDGADPRDAGWPLVDATPYPDLSFAGEYGVAALETRSSCVGSRASPRRRGSRARSTSSAPTTASSTSGACGRRRSSSSTTARAWAACSSTTAGASSSPTSPASTCASWTIGSCLSWPASPRTPPRGGRAARFTTSSASGRMSRPRAWSIATRR